MPVRMGGFRALHSKAMATIVTMEEVQKTPWFHSIRLSPGVITPGAKNVNILQTEAEVLFKHSVQGMSVLDVGAWDGFFSFEAERRGAARVLATDWFSWVGPGWGKKGSFDLARRALGSRVEDRIIDPMDITVEAVGQFDCVIFSGVLYHLRHPLYVLDRLAAITTHMLMMETHMDMLDVEKPAAAFYPDRELADDPSNWWGPNIPAAKGMLISAGFSRVEFTRHPGYAERGFFHAFK